MLLVQYTYPFDPNGTATTNKVVGERHTITPVNGPDFRFLIPRAAPYFKSSIQLRHVASNTPLLEGIHWAAGHKFDRASNTAPFLAVYGSVLILDNTIEGVIELTQYQTLGGEFTINETLVLELLANAQLDPRLAKWDNVLNTPTTYDPLLHRHHASESTGYEDMIDTLNRLADAIIANIGQSSIDQVARSHIANVNNPHNTTLAQLPDAQHLLGLNLAHIQYLIEQATSGGGGKFIPTESGQLLAGARIIPNNATPDVEFGLPLNPADLTVVEFIATPISFTTNPIRFTSADKIMGAVGPIVVNGHGECGLFIYFADYQTWWLYRTAIGAGGIGSNIGLPGDNGGIGGSAWSYYNGAPITKSSKIIPNNVTGPVTLPLPTSPTDLFEIEWEAGPTPFSQNSFTIQPTDKPVDGAMTAIVINTDGECGRLRYFAATQEWLLYKTGAAAGGTF